MNDDVRRLLEVAGHREVPPVADTFADGLEARLMTVAAGLPAAVAVPGTDGPVTAGPSGQRPSPRWLVAGLGAALAVVVLSVLVGQPRQAPDVTSIPIAALEEPVGVEVVLPGGEVLEDPDGLYLPSGAIVRVGEGGSARIGDTLLGPGDTATVDEDRVIIERASRQGIVPGTRTGRSAASSGQGSPVPTRAAGGPDASLTAPPAVSPGPTRSPAGPASPEPTPVPVAQPTRTPSAPDPTTAPTASPAPTPTPPILRPILRARLISGPRVAVRWTATYRARSYVLLVTTSRTGTPPDPVYPGSRVLGEFAVPPERALRYRVPAGVVELKLQVLALRGNGTVLRRSRIVTITVPQATASPTSETAGDSPSPERSAGPSPDPGSSTGP